MNNAARKGTLIGMAVGLVVLAIIGVWLLQAQGAGPQALIAIWLWLLPALYVSGVAGWLIGRLIGGKRSVKHAR